MASYFPSGASLKKSTAAKKNQVYYELYKIKTREMLQGLRGSITAAAIYPIAHHDHRTIY
jgi:hypothetical protein